MSVLQGGCGISMCETRSLERSGGDVQRTAPEDCQRKIMRSSRSWRSRGQKKLLVLVQKEHKLMK